MSPESRYRSVPLHRRWIADICHFGKQAHVVGCNWKINIAPALAARAAQQPAISWAAIWMKAIALVGRRRTELRTSYLPYPWARLYLHPECVCTIPVERTWQGYQAVFFQQFRRPDTESLTTLDHRLRDLKRAPIESIGGFRRLIRFARPPVIVRRLLWGVVLHWLGPVRARYMGTFALDPFPTKGIVTQSMTPLPFLLYYGLFEPNGDGEVQVMFDHRVMDGATAYRIVREIEMTINRDIAAELRGASGGAEPTIAEPPIAVGGGGAVV